MPWPGSTRGRGVINSSTSMPARYYHNNYHNRNNPPTPATTAITTTTTMAEVRPRVRPGIHRIALEKVDPLGWLGEHLDHAHFFSFSVVGLNYEHKFSDGPLDLNNQVLSDEPMKMSMDEHR